MVGGRRRKSNASSLETEPIVPSTPAVAAEDAISVREMEEDGSRSRHEMEDADDPFAYDSDLETLSSVSSHSSMSSSSSSIGEQTRDMDSDPDQQLVSAGIEGVLGEEHMALLGGRGEQGLDEPSQYGAARRERTSSGGEDGRSGSKAGIISTMRSSPYAGDGVETDGSELPEQVSALETPDTCDSGGTSRRGKRKHCSDDMDCGPEDAMGDEDALASEAQRSSALVELTEIEVEFAKLRERLYSERLQQVQIEEEYLAAGQHAEYERHMEDVSTSHALQLERLQASHEAWGAHRQQMHDGWLRAVKYTYQTQRQELRSRLLAAQRKRMWRLRDARVLEDRCRAEKATPQPHDVASLRQLKRERRAATTAQRCLVHMRQQRLAVAGLDADEMDADYAAMSLPVYAREPRVGGFRRIFVPPPDDKKRKPRQPRRKKPDTDSAGKSSSIAMPPRPPPPHSPPAAPRQAVPLLPAAAKPRGASANGHAVRPPGVLKASAGGAGGRPPPLALPAAHSLQTGARAHPTVGRPVLPSRAATGGGVAASSDDATAAARGSVDMHVPPGTSGPLGLRV
ncbi:hypothetical protein EV174_002693 [Coemansia sp. RSA 2320]|nr:hypothetical protein EV174_002693 [Coemansia sp. RSA 2320]